MLRSTFQFAGFMITTARLFTLREVNLTSGLCSAFRASLDENLNFIMSTRWTWWCWYLVKGCAPLCSARMVFLIGLEMDSWATSFTLLYPFTRDVVPRYVTFLAKCASFLAKCTTFLGKVCSLSHFCLCDLPYALFVDRRSHSRCLTLVCYFHTAPLTSWTHYTFRFGLLSLYNPS